MTPQNIYDHPDFYAGYASMERFAEGWVRAVEHDDLLALLPPPAGLRALDLGCGTGQLARFLAAQGASSVLGVDLSERMLAVAGREYAHPRVRYERAALEALSLPEADFDLVVSSLAVHYLDDYHGLLRRIARWLAAGGVLVLSTEHPLYTGRLPGEGWVMDASGRADRWAVRRYFDEGPRDEDWFVTGVRKVHRTLSTLVNGVVEAGLVLERVIEPAPSEAWLREHPQSMDEAQRPMFILLRARKPVAG
ncbi:MAG: methyltransferase domain-containing protein [Chloroflexi bacterium]|nr:methyltransferase domain-containing protein [Chloroflexota bacterium]